MNVRNSVLVLLVSTSTLSGALSVVVPNGLEQQAGNSPSLTPFFLTANYSNSPSIRYQQVYDGGAFSVIKPPGAYLTRLFMRGSTNTMPGQLGQWRNLTGLQISFSTTSRPADALSLLFADNVGTNDTVMFGPAPLLVSPRPLEWLEFPLTNGFWYDPAEGNLLLDVRIYGVDFYSYPNQYGWDAQVTSGDTVSRIFSDSVDAPTASNADSLGLVTLFQFDPVPSLTNSVTTNAVVITWPVQPTTFILQWTDRIVTNANWQPYTNTIGGGGLYHVLTLPRDSLDQAKFFRLVCPSCPPIPSSSLSTTPTAIKKPTVVH